MEGTMLRLEELKSEIKGEFFLREELKKHDVKKVDALADVIIKPAGKKELQKLLLLLEKSGYPHLVINSKGRVVFPDRRFHGAVVLTDLKM
jgi:UDP-N-acetylenolpyruvoylglucosamine reductase